MIEWSETGRESVAGRVEYGARHVSVSKVVFLVVTFLRHNNKKYMLDFVKNEMGSSPKRISNPIKCWAWPIK